MTHVHLKLASWPNFEVGDGESGFPQQLRTHALNGFEKSISAGLEAISHSLGYRIDLNQGCQMT